MTPETAEFDRKMLEALVCPKTQGTLSYDAGRRGETRERQGQDG